MDFPNRPYIFREAVPEDGDEMLTVLENPDFKGDLCIIYTRRPNPYHSFMAEGSDVLVLVARHKETDELIGFGSCTINSYWFDGRLEKVGYLSGLRVKKEFRMMPRLLTDGYRYMMALLKERGVEILYTTVLDDNINVQAMFEKRRRNFPYYIPVGSYRVHCGTVRMTKPCEDVYDYAPLRTGEVGDLIVFLNAFGKSRDFYPGMLNEILKGTTGLGLSSKDFLVARDRATGAIKAALAVWQQQKLKQHILYRYGGMYKVLRHLGHLLPYIGYPKMPKEGTILDYYTLSFYGYESIDALEGLVRYAAKNNATSNYFIMGTTGGTPEDRMLERITKITYTSKIYMVDYIKNEQSLARVRRATSPYIECGLL